VRRVGNVKKAKFLSTNLGGSKRRRIRTQGRESGLHYETVKGYNIGTNARKRSFRRGRTTGPGWREYLLMRPLKALLDLDGLNRPQYIDCIVRLCNVWINYVGTPCDNA
jgi:hypothetical protein